MKERWSGASLALHWLAGAGIVALASAGFVMTDLAADAGARLVLSRLHTLGGVALMLVTKPGTLACRSTAPTAQAHPATGPRGTQRPRAASPHADGPER